MPKEKDKGPKPFEIVIAAVLSFIIGVLGAGVFLAFQPLEKVNEMPAEEDRVLGKVYYVEGKGGDTTVDGRTVRGTWEPKEGAVRAGRSGTLSLVEQELNQWAAQRLKGGGSDDLPALHIEPARPNFRLADDQLYVMTSLEWSAFGVERTFDSLVSGPVVSRGGTHELDHEQLYVGSLPVPNLFGLADRLVRDVVDSYDVPEELREGWANLETVSIDGDTLELVIP